MSRSTWCLDLLLAVLALLVLGASGVHGHSHHRHHRRCVIGNVPTHQNFDIQRFTGTWYMLSMLEGTTDFNSAIIHFVMRSDNHLSSHFVSAQGSNCQAEMEGTWHTGNVPGDIFADYGVVSGPAKIVYVTDDYTYAVIYQCFHVHANGTCAMKYVDYIGRRHRLPASVKRQLATHLSGTCVRPQDFIDMSQHVPRCLRRKAAEYTTLQTFEDAPVSARRRRRSVNLQKESFVDRVLGSDEVVPRDGYIPSEDTPKGPKDRDYREASSGEIGINPEKNLHVLMEDEQTVKKLMEFEEEQEESGESSNPSNVPGELEALIDDSDEVNNDTERCVHSECSETCSRRTMRVDSQGCTICACEEESMADLDGKLKPNLPTDSKDPPEERTEHAELLDHPKEPIPCANLVCKNWCPNGYAFNEWGCMTCRCRDEPLGMTNRPEENAKLPEQLTEVDIPCAIPMCMEECIHGYVHTERGCMTCSCKDGPSGMTNRPEEDTKLSEVLPEVDVPCAIPMCMDECVYGYVHTQQGCMTCTCRDKPSGMENLPEENAKLPEQLPEVDVPCAIPMCMEECEHGYVHTEQGCMTCTCRGSDGTTATTRSPCHVDDVPTAENIDIKRMEGRWYYLAILSGSARFTSASIFLHIHNNSTVSSFFAAAYGGKCFPTIEGTWTKSGGHPGRYTANHRQNTDTLRIVYVDPGYTYSITYQCFRVNSDGTCAQESTDLIGREPSLPYSVKEKLLAHAHKACGWEVKDFKEVSHPVTCTPKVPTWAQRSCKVRDFPTATDLDWTRMLGHWYTMVQPRDGENIHAGEYLLKARRDGAVNIIFHAYSDGECIEARHATIYPDPTNPGELTLQVGHSKSEGRIVFTDYTSMVFYQCSKHKTQGACMEGHDTVEVLHRQRHPTRHLVDYGRIIDGLCIDADRVTNVSHRVTCPIREFCRVADVLQHPNLDIDKFSGRWHTLATLKTDIAWDYVTAIFARESPVTLAVWYTGSRNGKCLPPSKALLRSPSGSTNMTLSFGRTEATFKVLYTDYTSYAVTYECERKSRDGHCSHNAEHLEVLARGKGARLTEQLLEQLAPYLGNACKEKEDLRKTLNQADCPIRRPPSSCKIDYMPAPTNFNLGNFMGTWHTIAKNKEVQGITSIYLEMSLVGKNDVLTATHFTRKGYCVSGTRKTITSNPAFPAEFISMHGRHKERARVLYVSAAYDSAVVYQCDLEHQNGSCVKGHEKVTIMSRTTTITSKAKVAITEALLGACVEPASIHDMIHTGECQPMRLPPSNRPACSIQTIPATKKLNIKQLLGQWFILWRMRGSPTLDGDVMVNLSAGEEETVHAQYTGSRRGTCVPPTTATWRLRSTDQLADFTVTSANITGRLKVVHTNYQEALVYECHQVRANGSCVEGQASLDIYSRSHEIPRRLRAQLFKYALTRCRDARKLTSVDHTLGCEDIQPRTCTLQEVPVVAQIDLPRLMGTWYSSARLIASPSWHAGVINFDLLEDGNILAKVTGARKGKCMKVTTIVLETQESHAEFIKPNGGLIKLVFTNKQQALIYECDSVRDGHCRPGYMTVDVLSRSPDPLPTGVMTQIAPLLSDMCLAEADFVASTSNVDCTETLFEQEQCMIKMEDISMQRHFDVNMLLGEWYGYAHTYGDNPLASTKNLLSRDEHGNLKVYYTGSRLGKCVQTKVATIEVSDSDPSVFTIYHDGRREHALILHVAPDELVIYTCYLRIPDGTCAPEHTTIEIFRRRQNMLGGMSPRVRQAVSRACFNPAEFTLTIHDVDCPLEVHHGSCSFSDLPVDKNFDMRALTGHWYTISRLTPRGDLKRKSSRNYIVYKSRDTLALTWIARMGRNCTEQKQGSMQAIPNDQAGIFRTTFGSWTSITKFIHLSDNYAITFDCVQPSSRIDVIVSVCDLSEAEVEIHSRRPTTPQTAINVLKDILRQKTCIDVNRMDDMRPADTCPLKVSSQKSCRIHEIPLHPNVTVPLLAGAWFQIMHTKTESVLPSKHGELFIDTTNHHMGWMTLHMRGKDGDNCNPAFHVQAYSSTLDRAHWLFMATNSMPAPAAGTLKIVYADSNLLLLHTCLGPSPIYKALCDKTKEAVQVYSHRRYLNSRDHAIVRDILRHKLCVDELLLHRTTHSERCGIPRYAKRSHGPPSCKVHDYSALQGFQPKKFAGIWHEIERTRYSHANLWESPVTHFAYQDSNHLSLSHAGSREDECVGPFRAHLILNAPTDATAAITGDMTMWLGPKNLVGSPWSVHFPYKVIWTDYEVAVIYSCHQVADNGRCRHHGEQVHVISRSPEVGISTRLQVYKIITEQLCVDVVDLVEPAKEADCLSIFGLDLPSHRLPQPQPTQTCDVIECDLNCSLGYVQSEAGCDMCECRHFEFEEGSGDVKQQVVLPTDDGSGEVVDAIDSTPDTAPVHSTSDGSEQEDVAINPTGVGITEIPDVICAPVECPQKCHGGYMKNDKGCSICQCDPLVDGQPEEATVKYSTPAKVNCGNNVCFYLCPYGFKVDENGCPICTCAERPKTEVGNSNVRLFWVKKGFGKYGLLRPIIEPYITKGVAHRVASEKDSGGLEQVTEIGQGIVNEDEMVAMGNKGIIPVDGDVGIRGKEEQISEEELFATSDGLLLQEEMVARDDQMVAKERDVVTGEHTVVARDDQVVAKERDVVTAEHTVVARDDQVVAKERDVVTGEHTVVAREGDTIDRKEESIAREDEEKVSLGSERSKSVDEAGRAAPKKTPNATKSLSLLQRILSYL